MRKIAAFGLATAMSVLLAGSAFSADNSTVDVVMSIQTISILNVSGNVSVAAVPGSSRVTDRAIFRNDGNGNEDFSVRIASTTGSWTPVTGAPGANQYRLSGLWHEWNVRPTVSEFQANDVITTSNQLSSDTVFFNDAETHATAGTKGYNVAPGAEGSIFFKFDAPSSGTGSATSHVNVTATATP